MQHPAETLVKNVIELLDNLDRAVEAGAERPLSLDEQRKLYVWTLTKVSVFVGAIGTIDHARLISDLALSLDDLQEGTVAPFLKPAIAHTRQSSMAWRARADVAVGIVALLRLSDMTRNKAVEQMLHNFPHIRLLLRGKSKDPAKAALSWHDEFALRGSERRTKNREGINAFEESKAILDSLSSPELIQKFADIAFQMASRLALRI